MVVAGAMPAITLASPEASAPETRLPYDADWLGDPEVVACLLRQGAEVDGRDQKGWTPLHTVVDCSDSTGPDCRKVVERLLAAGADVDARAENEDTPLKLAMKNAYTGPADLLRGRGGRG
jgi:ankyrin repeat protein